MSGNAAEILNSAESVLDEMPATVALLIEADGALAVSSAGKEGTSALLAQNLAQAVGGVAFAAKKVAHTARAFEQRRCSLYFADIAGGLRLRSICPEPRHTTTCRGMI